MNCPQCEEPLKDVNTYASITTFYCDYCGWPSENKLKCEHEWEYKTYPGDTIIKTTWGYQQCKLCGLIKDNYEHQ